MTAPHLEPTSPVRPRPSAAGQPPKFQLQASTLQQAALDCMAAAEKDPRNVEAREAAAQAHIRLVVIGAVPNRERKLLDRAIELDPYSAPAFLLAALARHRDGALSEALGYYDHACWLSPFDTEIRYHRGYALLEAARRPDLSEEEAAELAEAAAADFEAVLKRVPEHAPAALGAIETAIQGKVTKLRDSMKGLFARVTPHEAFLRSITVLLYQVIFAFRVGKAKNVDQKNQKTMADVTEIARTWIAAFPHDADLAGVVSAAKAKCESPEGLCEQIADYARGIPDVRILRLLMRERLAEVPDARRRLELFESAMKRIPPLDGIAHDYLQLKHLTGKRAVAEGDLTTARATWLECEEIDPDNPSVVLNLRHLASSRGDTTEVARLTARLEDLWSLYAQVSPRPDLVLMRAHARHEAHVVSELDRFEQAIMEEKRPSVSEIEALLDRWLIGQALARLAVDGDVRDEVSRAALSALLSFGVLSEEALDVAHQVLDAPMTGDFPTAYAYLDLAKDVPDDEIPRSLEALRERLDKNIESFAAEEGDPSPFQALLARALEETRPLLNPVTRAAYDHATVTVDRSEICRRQCDVWRRLARVAAMVSETDVAPRARIAEKLAEVPRTMMEPYLATAMQDGKWFEVMLLRIRYLGLIRRAWELFGKSEVRQALVLCERELTGAGEMFAAHELFATLMLRDSNQPLWVSVEAVQRSARRALEVAHWTESVTDIKSMRELANAPDLWIAQRSAAGRALTLLESRSRDAIDVLWQAYPGHRNVAYPSTRYGPVVEPLSKLEPIGRGFYAFVVARAIRSACIDWFNGQHPASHYEHMSLKATARGMGSSAHRWANYALSCLGQETLPASTIHDIFEGINGLLSALQRDAGSLS